MTDVPTDYLDALPDAIVVVDSEGTIVQSNTVAIDMFRGSLTGRTIEELIPQAARDAHREHRTKFAENSERRSMGIGLELEALRLDDSTFPADISLSPLIVDGRAVTMAAVRDVSERRMAERELQAAQERLATMEDRERIARDLHDVVIQEIFGSGLSLQSTLGRIEDEEVRVRIEGTVERLDETIGTLRGVIFDLQQHRRRSSLEEAIADVVAGAERQLGFDVAVDLQGPRQREVVDEVLTDFGLTLREALTNIGKHASASRADVVVRANRELVLVVTDDGVGIGTGTDGGFGVGNMAERATRHGGSFSIDTREQGGTRLEWRVPIL